MDDCPVVKVTFIGDSGVGKSCLVQRHALGVFTDFHVPTIGVDYALHRILRTDAPDIRMQLWDTAGQERFRSITLAYYRGASIVVLVHDLTEPDHALPYWHEQARQHADPRARILVFGTKKEKAPTGTHAAQRWAQEHGLPYYALSAKTSDGLGDAFAALETLAKALCPAPPLQDQARVNLQSRPQRARERLSQCCGRAQ